MKCSTSSGMLQPDWLLDVIFGNQTEGLVHDFFVLNMSNKVVQKKLCTEPKKTPAEALQFAIAFEDGSDRKLMNTWDKSTI